MLRHLQANKLVEAADSTPAGTPATEFKQALETLRNEEAVGDVRGIGLLWAVEFVADKATKRPISHEKNFAGRVGAAALKRGLLVYPMQGSVDGVSGDHLLLAPPAIITGEQITWAAEQLRAAVRDAKLALESALKKRRRWTEPFTLESFCAHRCGLSFVSFAVRSWCWLGSQKT